MAWYRAHMFTSRRLLTTGLILFGTFATTRAQSAEPTVEERIQALKFMAGFFVGIQPETGAVDEVPADDALPTNRFPDNLVQGLSLFQKSFFFDSAETAKNELVFEGDSKQVPWAELVRAKLAWTAARDSGKKNVLDVKANGAARMQSLDDANSGKVLLSREVAPKVRQLEGKMTLRYPTGISILEFSAADTRTEKKAGDLTCRLLRAENDLAAIWCNRVPVAPLLFAVSASGVNLDTRGVTRGPWAFYEETQRKGKVSDQTLDTYAHSMADLDKEGLVTIIKAKGKVAKVVVARPTGFKEDERDIVAWRTPDFSESCPKIPAPRFATPIQSPLALVTLDAARVLKETSIRPARSHAMSGFNDPLIIVSLPHYANSYFAEVKVKDLTLTKGMKKVAFDGQGPFLGDSGITHSYRMDPDRSSVRGPVDFDTAEGTVEIRFPTAIRTRRVSSKEPSDTIAIDGCSVELKARNVKLDRKDKRPILRAYSVDGRALQLVGTVLAMYSGEGPGDQELRYWGQVDHVEIDEVTTWANVTIPVRLKAAPLLLEEK